MAVKDMGAFLQKPLLQMVNLLNRKSMQSLTIAEIRLTINAIQLSIISVVFCHRGPLFFMPKNFKNITKNS